MKTFAGFALFISIVLGSDCPATQPQEDWEYEVDAAIIWPGATLSGGFEEGTPVLSKDGTVSYTHLTLPTNREV